ncbi:hypothetical protein [Nocardia goodfellowii]|uniref:Threonine/homoserine/homoserine lactone efflux protein n=1 Tax=Nocardia goodfellowii TaxID=882446 RepID=A0ABS4QET2_9NOCA|nr:hypothetical protein [Nocardia goodfellowii]MBP2189594.1 threonine/homoserine/homoserine lactone efflux protein [Nocardia goodfellowii]
MPANHLAIAAFFIAAYLIYLAIEFLDLRRRGPRETPAPSRAADD